MLISDLENGLTEEDLDILLGDSRKAEYKGDLELSEHVWAKAAIGDEEWGKENGVENDERPFDAESDVNKHGNMNKDSKAVIRRKCRAGKGKRAQKQQKAKRERSKNSAETVAFSGICYDEFDFVVSDDEDIPPDWEYNYEKPIVSGDVAFYNRVDAALNEKYCNRKNERVNSKAELSQIEKEYIDDMDNTESIIRERAFPPEDKGNGGRRKRASCIVEMKRGKVHRRSSEFGRGCGDSTNLFATCKQKNMFSNVHRICSSLSSFFNSSKSLFKYTNRSETTMSEAGSSRLLLLFKAIDVEFNGLLSMPPSLSVEESSRQKNVTSNMVLFSEMISDLSFCLNREVSGNLRDSDKGWLEKLSSLLKQVHFEMIDFIKVNIKSVFSPNEDKYEDRFECLAKVLIRVLGLTLSLERLLVNCIADCSRNSELTRTERNLEHKFACSGGMFKKGTVSKFLRQTVTELFDRIFEIYNTNHLKGGSNLCSLFILISYLSAKLRGADSFVRLSEILLMNPTDATNAVSLYSYLLFSYLGINERSFNPTILFPKHLFVCQKHDKDDQSFFCSYLCSLNDYFIELNILAISNIKHGYGGIFDANLNQRELVNSLIEFATELGLSHSQRDGDTCLRRVFGFYRTLNTRLSTLIMDLTRLVLGLRHYSYLSATRMFLFGHQVINKYVFLCSNDALNTSFSTNNISEFEALFDGLISRENDAGDCTSLLRISASLYVNMFNFIAHLSSNSEELWNFVMQNLFKLDFNKINSFNEEDIFVHFSIHLFLISALLSRDSWELNSLLLKIRDKYCSETEKILDYLLTEMVLSESDHFSGVGRETGEARQDGGLVTNGLARVKEKYSYQANIELIRHLRAIVGLFVALGKGSALEFKLDSLKSAIELVSSNKEGETEAETWEDKGFPSFLEFKNQIHDKHTGGNHLIDFLHVLELVNSVDLAGTFNFEGPVGGEKQLQVENSGFGKMCDLLKRTGNLILGCCDSMHSGEYQKKLVPDLFFLLNNIMETVFAVVCKSVSNLRFYLCSLRRAFGGICRLILGKLVEFRKDHSDFDNINNSTSSLLMLYGSDLIIRFWDNLESLLSERSDINGENNEGFTIINNIKIEIYYFVLAVNCLAFNSNSHYLKHHYFSHIRLHRKLRVSSYSVKGDKFINIKSVRSNKSLLIVLLLDYVSKCTKELLALICNSKTSDSGFEFYNDLIKTLVTGHILENWKLAENKDSDVGLSCEEKVKQSAYLRLFFYYYLYSDNQQFILALNEKLKEFSVNLYQSEVIHGFLLNFYIKGMEVGKQGDLNWINVSNSIKGMLSQLDNDMKLSEWIVHYLFSLFMIPSYFEIEFIALRSRIWSSVLSIPLSTLVARNISQESDGFRCTLHKVVMYINEYLKKLNMIVYYFAFSDGTFSKLNRNNALYNMSINFIFDLNRLIHLSYFDITLTGLASVFVYTTNLKSNVDCTCMDLEKESNLQESLQMFSDSLLMLLFISETLLRLVKKTSLQEDEKQTSICSDIMCNIKNLRHYILGKSILFIHNLNQTLNVESDIPLISDTLFRTTSSHSNIEMQTQWINKLINGHNALTKVHDGSSGGGICTYISNTSYTRNYFNAFISTSDTYKLFASFKRDKKRKASLYSKNEKVICSDYLLLRFFNSNLSHIQSQNCSYRYLLEYVKKFLAENQE